MLDELEVEGAEAGSLGGFVGVLLVAASVRALAGWVWEWVGSAGAMRDYMKDDAMPWLAVKFDQRTQELMSYSGPGIPCLVLVAEKLDGRSRFARTELRAVQEIG